MRFTGKLYSMQDRTILNKIISLKVWILVQNSLRYDSKTDGLNFSSEQNL